MLYSRRRAHKFIAWGALVAMIVALYDFAVQEGIDRGFGVSARKPMS
jgi:hypothetical protein